MGRVCMGRLGNGPSLQWAEFVMDRDVQLPCGLHKLPSLKSFFFCLYNFN